MTLRAPLGLVLVLIAGPARATEYVVAAAGGDFTSVQAGLDVAVAGDTVTVRQKPTPYFAAPARQNDTRRFRDTLP